MRYASSTAISTLGPPRYPYLRVPRFRVLGDVRQRLGHNVVGGRLDLGRQLSGELERERDRQRGQRHQLLDGAGQPPFGQHRWVHALRQAAKLFEHGQGGVLRLPDQRQRPVRAGAQRRLGQAERHGDRQQPLLHAVVQVALQPPPFRLRRPQQLAAGVGELAQPRPQVHGEALVLECQRHRRARGLDQLGVLPQRRVVYEQRERIAAAVYPGPDRLPIRRRRYGPAAGIHVMAGVG
jgi:hypothetical protein